MKEEQTINGLLEGWKIVDVNSIGRVETGSTPSKQNANYYADEFPFYKPTDLEAGYNVRIAKDNLSEAGIKQARFLPENSILVTCIGATIGKTGLIRKAGASNQQINAIIPSDNVHPSFIYYQVISPEFQKKIKDNASATTLPILNKTKFQNLPFILAPITEQQQIVSKIEELFSELDKGMEELKTAQQQLKVYRQAVLKWAFEGKLTNEDVKDGELPKGWENMTIGELFEVFIGSTPSRKNLNYWDGNTNWVSSGEVAFKSITDTKEKISQKGLENSSCKVHPPGTVIMAMIGEGKTRGQAAILKVPAAHNQNTAAIRVPSNYKSELLYYFLVLKYEENRKIGSGNNQKALNKERVKGISIPFIPFEEQQQIVQEVESRLSVCDKIEETITFSLKQAEALRQSILKEAFQGRIRHTIIQKSQNKHIPTPRKSLIDGQ